MTKIAIDVVLLPSGRMMDRAISINRELLKNHEILIVLDKENCLPHISLCMGCIEEDRIPEIKIVLDEIASSFSTFDLIAENLTSVTTPDGKKVSGLQIQNQALVQRLHETAMKKLWKYLSYEVGISMFFNPPEVEEATLYWVRNYADYYRDPSLFHPHITVGFGETNKFRMPIHFTASEIAIYQLGNYCTCRKVILSARLKRRIRLPNQNSDPGH